MAYADTSYILGLVRRSLDEFEDCEISAIARRTARVASLLSETELAVWLGMELKPTGGHPPANADDTRRLMDDPSKWGDPEGPAERALIVYTKCRRIRDGEHEGLILAWSLGEIEDWLRAADDDLRQYAEWLHKERHMREIQERVRHSCFAALCSWERRLSYSNVNEQIFDRFRARVDAQLSDGAPQVLDQFSAVYRRLSEAARDPEAPMSEELAQAVTTCRRILKAIADHLLPGAPGATSDAGNRLDDSAYRNRIFEYVKKKSASDKVAETINSELGGLIERFNALDGLASKGVHASVALTEAETCAIATYIVAGELLRLG